VYCLAYGIEVASATKWDDGPLRDPFRCRPIGFFRAHRSVISSRPDLGGVSRRKVALLILNVNTKLYIGNLAGDVTETGLTELFSKKGPVLEVKLMLDADTGRSRGSAFVTMGT